MLSIVTGRLSVQEGGGLGAYTLLGVPFQQALLASILFHLVYYVIPFGSSLGFYWRLLRVTGVPL